MSTRKLTSEIAKSDPPTIFQINGPVGYQNWADYCADLKDTELYNLLSDKTLAVTKDEGVYGVPYAVEGYGIISMMRLCRSTSRLTAQRLSQQTKSRALIHSSLLFEDMTSKKDELGIDGVFGSTSLKTGDDWRWQTHLMNVPFTMNSTQAPKADYNMPER